MSKLLLMFILWTSLIMGMETLQSKQNIRIPLMRQRTLREQLQIAPNLKMYGIDFEWLHKPHKYDLVNDSITLLRNLDAELYGRIQIGQLPQEFKVLFDTAWYTSWVLSSDCGIFSPGCWFHNKYSHKQSTTYRPVGTPFNVDDGSYKLTGIYSNDTLWIGSSRVDGQVFVEMTNVPSSYFMSKTDGVMALGFKGDGFNPFIYNMFNNKSIDKKLFSIYINRDPDAYMAGDISLGFINNSYIKHHLDLDTNRPHPEKIFYLPVNPDEGYWRFAMDRITVNATRQNETSVVCKLGCNAIIDSTSNNIIGPKSEIDAINKLIGTTSVTMGRDTIKCNKINKLPAINFVLAGKNFTLQGSNYILKKSNKCVSAFIAPSAPTEEKYWILGGAFLSEFYSIYDMDNHKIGFVTAT